MPNNDDIIFVLQGDNALEAVSKHPYQAEEVLQELLERHPELLVGEQLDPDTHPRWLLVKREAEVPDGEDRPGRWALDHLFIDQHATPTFVEVKRGTDTRIRREVVGQMLDYAANGAAYWPDGHLRAMAIATLGSEEHMEEAVATLLDDDDVDDSVDEFWKRAAQKLNDGEVRLVFLADEIPRELKRIIEYLNEHMERVHVVGLELVQYKRDGLRLLVPRAVGVTEAARAKRTRRSRKTNRNEFLESNPPHVRPFFEQVLREADSEQMNIYWGTQGFSVRTAEALHGTKTSLFYCFPPGAHGSDHPYVEVYLHTQHIPVDLLQKHRPLIEAISGAQPLGDYTIRFELDTESGLANAGAALKILWKLQRELQATA